MVWRRLACAATALAGVSGAALAEDLAGKTLSCVLESGGVARDSVLEFVGDGRFRRQGGVEETRPGCVSAPAKPELYQIGEAYRFTETCAETSPPYVIETTTKVDIRGEQIVGLLRGRQLVNGAEQVSWEGGWTASCDGAVCTRHTDVSSRVKGEATPRQRSFDERCTLE